MPLLEIRGYPGFWSLWFQAWQARWKENLGIEMKINVHEAGAAYPNENMSASSAGSVVPDPGFMLYLVGHSKGIGSMHTMLSWTPS